MIGKFNDSYNLPGVPLMAASGRRQHDGLVHFLCRFARWRHHTISLLSVRTLRTKQCTIFITTSAKDSWAKTLGLTPSEGVRPA